ncbi:MAG TPA: SLBB domain-containing protein [Terriglobales bacterium]|nr:SLBB domain-containing protein [Terriglobales bacterium]
MSLSVGFTVKTSVSLRQQASNNLTPSRPSRAGCFAAALILAISVSNVALSAYGQATIDPTSTQTAAQSQTGDNNVSESATTSAESDDTEEAGRSTGSAGLTSQTALSAEQIINILQESPDLVVELKSELADRLQQQGVQIDPNQISDQELYNQVSSNANLRASITSVLRARGYVSDDDLQSVASSLPAELTTNPLFPASSRSLQSDASAEAGLAARTGVSEGSGQFGESDGSESVVQSSRQHQEQQSTLVDNRRKQNANASTDLPRVLRTSAPYDLQSMRDLYAQIPAESTRLKRFGSDVFINRDVSAIANGISGRNTPLDVPLGPDYIVGPGDTLTVNVWGGVTQSTTRTVDRDGRIFLPEAGSIQLAGLSLENVQGLLGSELKRQFRDAQVAVTVSRLRSVRVYVVGDVQQPGGYDISALATPLSAFYTAGGPTPIGSLRTLLHYRGKQLVEKVDLYDFLLHGIRNGSAPFESGDTLLVPPAGPQVAILGAIKRPAIYELQAGKTTLASLIEDAGGFTAAASLNHITIERIDAHRERVTVTLPDHGAEDLATSENAIDHFQVEDGDRIRIEPILPYSQRAVYLAGHVVRPGRLPYSDGMRLSDVLHSYRDLLPEPAARGEIVRLTEPDLHAETIEFNVPDVLIGNAKIYLRPFDTIRIFGRYEVDAPKVTIRGEVLRPGTYPMSKGMTAAGLVRMAGGFKQDALLDSADLTSYDVNNSNRLVEDLATVRIGAAVAGSDPHADVPLKPGDILAIHEITNWNDMGESVTINGQVRFPGSYGFKDGERLSSVLRRAGGLLPTAYPMGAVMTRIQVRVLEQNSRDELIRQIEASSAAARLSPSLAGSNAAAELQLIKAQQEQVLAELKSHPPTGRLVIHINADISSWENTPADIELRGGDVLTIPKRPGFVLVTGQVYNATALSYTPDRTAGWYLSRAGGANEAANRKEIFVIRANGSVVGRRSGGWFDGDVLSTKLNPGDVVVVPQKILGGSLLWRNLLSAGQLAGSVAITAGVAAAAL